MPRKPELSDQDRAAVSQSVKHAKLIEASRRLARIIKHADPEPKVKAQRTRLEKSLTAWMKHHGGEAFDRPFSADHKKCIAKIEAAVNDGGLFALAMPRGHGKSTILKWATLYCLLTGRRKYVVVIAATAELSQAIVDFARQQIQESETLHAHYPHVTTYARATDGKAIKAKYQLRADGKTSGIHWSKTTLVLPEVSDVKGVAYKSNGAILEGHGLTGHIRGKWKDTKTGKTLRPDFVLLDDPQSRESAESESQCTLRGKIITGDVLGLAGPRKRIAAVMPCTIIRKGDLADQFLSRQQHPEWQGETCSLVQKWPDAQDTLWAEYGVVFREDGLRAATEFYRTHQAEMDKGAVVSWEYRVRDGELSAIQTAENLLIESGEQFWAEYQNDPKDAAAAAPYRLTRESIAAHVTDRPAWVVPEGVHLVTCGADINPSYGISWAVIGFEGNHTAHVLGYGVEALRIPQEWSEPQKMAAVFAALQGLRARLNAQECRPRLMAFDVRGWNRDHALAFGAHADRDRGLPAIPAQGTGWKAYRPTHKSRIGDPREGCHMAADEKRRKYLVVHSDYWREIMQLAFATSPGAPGSCSLPAGNHAEFADQILAEPLIGKHPGPLGMEWLFTRKPGKNDLSDAMVMAYAAAAWSGIGTGGGQQQPTRRRRPSGVTVIPI